MILREWPDIGRNIITHQKARELLKNSSKNTLITLELDQVERLAHVFHRILSERYKQLFSLSNKNTIGSITVEESLVAHINKIGRLPFKNLPKKEKYGILSDITRLLDVFEEFEG